MGNGKNATVTGVSIGKVTVTYAYTSGDTEITKTFVIRVVDDQPKISIEGDLVVGGHIQLSVQNFESADAIQWASDNTKVATVDSAGVVEGISVGKANITAFAGTESATKQIEVKRDESNGGYYVYLYIKVVGNTDGLKLTVNDNGWFTVGRVWVEGISNPATGSEKYDTSSDNYKKTMAALANPDNVDLYGVNNINLEDIEWSVEGQPTGLKTASGAVDYDTSNKSTWHLDGYVDLDKVSFGSIEFHYIDTDTKKEISEKESVTVQVTDKFDISSYKIPIEGYTYDYADSSDVVVVEKNKTKIVKFYYKKGTFRYTVHYKESGTENELADPKVVTAQYGSTVKEDAIAIKGYKVDGDPSQSFQVKADNNQINFYYVAKQGRVGYYLTDPNATWTAPTDTVDAGGLKYYYKYGFSKGDTVQVTDIIPTAPGKMFVGWLDKECEGQDAAIRKAGDTITYIYSKDQSYTLDALWASLAVTGYKGTYDGNEHGLASADIAINEGSDLDQQYQEQAKNFIKQGTILYRTDDGETWSETAPKYKDAGTYPVKVKVDVTVGGKTTTLEASAKIVIEPATLTVSTPDAERAYNGQPLTAEGSVEGFVNGESAPFKTTGSQIAVGESDNTYAIDWAASTTAKQSNYTIVEKLGKLTVTRGDIDQDNVTWTLDNLVKKYDGNTYAAGAATAVDAHGNALTVEYSADGESWTDDPATITAKDYSDSKLVKLRATGPNYAEGQYAFSEEPEQLIIGKRVLTLTSASAEKPYDGEALVRNAQADVAVEGDGFAAGEGATYDITGSQTQAGSSKNEFTYALKGNTKAENYQITVAEGDLKVKPVEAKVTVKVRGKTETKAYGGEEQSVEGYDFVSIDNPLYAEADVRLSGSAVAKGTDAGTYPMGLSADQFSNANENFADVEFVVEDGWLEITRGDIDQDNVTWTLDNLVKKYDGNTYAAGAATAVDAHGNALTVEYSADGESWTDDPATITAKDYSDSKLVKLRATGPNYAEGQYAFSEEPEQLIIGKRVLTLTSASAEKPYDGEALVRNAQADVAVEGDGFAAGEGATYDITGSQTQAGSSKNEFTYALKGNTKAENYQITVAEGDLKVKPVEAKVTVKVRGKTETKAYGGEEQSVEGYDFVSIDNPLYAEADVRLSGSAVAKGTDAGTYPMGLSADQFSNANENFADVEFVVEDGWLEITPATLTVTTPSASRAYNGQPLTAEGSIEGFMNGETAGFETTGSQTAVGWSNNTYAIDWNAKGATAKESNYKIVEKLGKLTVTEHDGEVVATPGSYAGVYDGKPHGVDVTVTGLPEGYTVKAAGSNATATDATDEAGVVANVDELVIVNAQGEDVTGKLNIKKNTGSIVITPAPYSVTTESATKVYDGTALTASGKIGGLLEGETANLKVTGSQTKVGASENTYTIEWTGTAEESNYKLESENIGTLTVAAAPDSPTPDDQSKDQGIFNGNDANSGLVQTGDATGIYGMAAIIAAVVAAFVSLLAVRRRKE